MDATQPPHALAVNGRSLYLTPPNMSLIVAWILMLTLYPAAPPPHTPHCVFMDAHMQSSATAAAAAAHAKVVIHTLML